MGGTTHSPVVHGRRAACPNITDKSVIFDMREENITFTLITNSHGVLTKTIEPDGKDGITKTPAAHMADGWAETVQVPFTKFGPYLRGIEPNQAIVHGVCGHDKVRVVSAINFTGEPGTITRSKEFFRYPDGPGIGMFDHDPKPGQDALSPEQFIDTLSTVCPEFRSVSTWWTPSTSSCIFDLDGNKLVGEGAGWLMYFSFAPASALPDFADRLFRKLWTAGYGYIFTSRAGSLLVSGILDSAVFSAEHLDFVAGAHCIDCEQRLPEPVYRQGLEEVAV